MGCTQSVPVYERRPQSNYPGGNRRTATPTRTPTNHRPTRTATTNHRPARTATATRTPTRAVNSTKNPTRTVTARTNKHKNAAFDTKMKQRAGEIQQRVQARKRSEQYRKKQMALVKQKKAIALTKAKAKADKEDAARKEQAKCGNFTRPRKSDANPQEPQPPMQRQLVRDINEYRRREATYSGDQDAPPDSAEFLKQAQELIPAEVLMVSGCEDEQTSADVMNAGGSLPDPKGRAGGAATSALLELLYQHKDEKFSFQDALMTLRGKLKGQGHSQIPQLTSSRPLDLDATPFTFHASNDGARRAVLVGINYVGQNGALRGCHNDVYHMKDYLVNVQGFPEKDILVMTDDGNGEQPTKQKMIAALRHMVDVSEEGDSVFFHYSGHGGFLEADQNSLKQKNDQYDQTLIPLDHRQAGQIRDFNLFNHFVRPMKAGVKVTCLMDCCHSGSVLDLPYSFKPTNEGRGEYRQESNFGQMASVAFLAIMAGAILDDLLFGPVCNTITYTVGSLDIYQGMYENMLYDDMVERAFENAIFERVIGDEIEREVEYEIRREIETEIEREIEQEIERQVEEEIQREIEQEIQREIEQEIQREIEREVQREVEREIQREMEREIQREMEREIQREVERQIEEQMFAANFDDDFW